MKHQFTEAVWRAIRLAQSWSRDELFRSVEPQALLLALFAQTECRASQKLLELGIDAEAICQRWPELSDKFAAFKKGEKPAATNAPRLLWSPEVEASFAALQLRLERMWFEQPDLATDHMLLALCAADHDVAKWLRQQGLDPDVLEAEIRKRQGQVVVAEQPLELEPKLPRTELERQTDDAKTTEPADTEPAIAKMSGAGDSRSTQQDFSEPPTINDARVLRAVDAAANRCREALRTVEDFTRFVLDDRFLTEQLKQLRHQLVSLLDTIPREKRLACRDTPGDVGTQVSTPEEMQRGQVQQVQAAGFARASESLRTLEEFCKLISPQLAVQIEQLRYRLYTLEKAVGTTARAKERLAQAQLYVLCDGRSNQEEFEQLLKQLVAAGVDIIQLREKELDDRTVLARAEVARKITRQAGVLFIVNDRPDIALAVEADGVHVGQEDLPASVVRRLVGPDMLIGVSTHSIQQAEQAVLCGADYIGCGPTFPSGTKEFEHFPGLDYLRQVSGRISLPAFAIGGITEENLDQVLETGFRRVAVSGAVIRAEDPAKAAGALVRRLRRA